MSGIYQNWIKVQNPNLNNNIIPMESGGYQKPFYFGGSQIPSNLNIDDTNLNISGNGIKGYSKLNFKSEKIKGKGIQTTEFKKNMNIHLPRHLKF